MYRDEVCGFLTKLVDSQNLIVLLIILKVLKSQDSGLGLTCFSTL
jgi:hypothetical protein